MTVSAAPDLRAYRRIVVAFSGGKDSLAALLHLLDLGVPAHVIELHHHDVDGRTLVVTGERAEESPGRAHYATFEPHRTHTLARSVDHWRPVHAWSEAQIWDAIAAVRIRPHPAYVLGWGRLSCRTCIFGSPAQWATVRLLFPAAFARVQAREAATGRTIHRCLSVAQLADRGRPYPAALLHSDEHAQAEDAVWRLPTSLDP